MGAVVPGVNWILQDAENAVIEMTVNNCTQNLNVVLQVAPILRQFTSILFIQVALVHFPRNCFRLYLQELVLSRGVRSSHDVKHPSDNDAGCLMFLHLMNNKLLQHGISFAHSHSLKPGSTRHFQIVVLFFCKKIVTAEYLRSAK